MFASVTPDTMKFTYLPTNPPQNPTTLIHLLYFFAFGKKEEMEKMCYFKAFEKFFKNHKLKGDFSPLTIAPL